MFTVGVSGRSANVASNPMLPGRGEGEYGKLREGGNVHASDREMALQNARDVYSRRNEAINLWVVPTEAITASTPEDMGPFFDPANDKAYRHPNFYKTPGAKF